MTARVLMFFTISGLNFGGCADFEPGNVTPSEGTAAFTSPTAPVANNANAVDDSDDFDAQPGCWVPLEPDEMTPELLSVRVGDGWAEVDYDPNTVPEEGAVLYGIIEGADMDAMSDDDHFEAARLTAITDDDSGLATVYIDGLDNGVTYRFEAHSLFSDGSESGPGNPLWATPAAQELPGSWAD